MKTIGIGIQDFAKIADKNMFYIDKTAFLKEWWENQDSVTLITRPRRFGKTLLMSMTDYFFSVNHSDCKKYFEGLDIRKEEKFRELQGTYPVIFMSFADIKGSTYEKTRMGIIHKITKLYTDFEFLKRTEFSVAETWSFTIRSQWIWGMMLQELRYSICVII